MPPSLRSANVPLTRDDNAVYVPAGMSNCPPPEPPHPTTLVDEFAPRACVGAKNIGASKPPSTITAQAPNRNVALTEFSRPCRGAIPVPQFRPIHNLPAARIALRNLFANGRFRKANPSPFIDVHTAAHPTARLTTPWHQNRNRDFIVGVIPLPRGLEVAQALRPIFR